jgi:hypothetical protein
MTTQTLDQICRRKTGFSSFADLLSSAPGYRPSTDMRDPDMELLADGYDEAMEERGDPRRAYRYGTPIPIKNKPGTTIIGGIHVTLSFETESDGSTVSSCFLTRGKESSSLRLVQDMGGIDGDSRFIPIPDKIVAQIESWAYGRGY